MKNSNQKTNWLVDAILFAVVLICFWLDLTGLQLHQWLGIVAAAIAVYHLLVHWNWLEAVTERFFGCTSNQARLYYLIDVALMLSFWLILISGLLISTWFDLPLENYESWKDLHITLSIGALLLAVIKIALHWRWIVSLARRSIFPPAVPQAAAPPARLAAAPVNTGRRDFLKLMGVVSAAALLSIAGVARGDEEDALASETSLKETAAGIAPSDTLFQNSGSEACVVRCNRGCAYPGHCRRYTDTKQNGRCDLGECL